MLAFLAFMALRLKSLRSAEFLCQNGPHKAKKYKISISVAVAFSVAFENFFGLFLFFLRSLIPKKSSGMQKPYVGLATPPTKNQHKYSILVHCVLEKNSLDMAQNG